MTAKSRAMVPKTSADRRKVRLAKMPEVAELARCTMFALSYLKGNGLCFNFKTKKLSRWEDDFMDALAAIGVEIRRKEYYASKEKKQQKKARLR